MDWESLRYFLALARYRRLVAAAERLGVEHNTIRRRVIGLESSLGARLFDKTRDGWVLTLTGEQLLPFAESIEIQADEASAAIIGNTSTVERTVRLVATDGFGGAVIAPGLAALREKHPGLHVELVTANRMLNLSVGEFDVAVTIHRPEHPSVRSRHLCDYDLRLYAAPGYLERAGTPGAIGDLAHHQMAWFIDSLLDLPELRSAYVIADLAEVVFRTTNIFAQVEAVAAGIGLGLLPCFLAHDDPRLRPVLHGELSARRSFSIVVPARLLGAQHIGTVTAYLQEIADAAGARLIP